jgi:TPP-dependent pyruvate/acetoin dehydrogenase alpha subunit
MRHPIVIPHLGATGGDVRMVSWEAEENQKVRAGEVLFTVETDKAVTEVPAFRDGILVAISAAAGHDYPPGTVVAHLADEDAVRPPTYEKPSSIPPAGLPKARVRVRTDSPPDRVNLAEPLVVAYATMSLIRRYEEHLYNLFLQGLVPGTLHQCQGQEAVAVGVCSALRTDDVIYSTHRPVGHLIAKGASLDAITAEIWGKATGCVGGKGGQMHLADFSVGAMVTNAIVGANIPIATGSAMAYRMLGLDRVAVSFFGDGASNIGAFHEGLNLAAVKRAPAVFICENNLYAASTHISLAAAITDIADRAGSYGMPGMVVDGMDVEAVYAATTKAVARARRGDGPTLIECKTYRYRGHSRGDPGGYRGAEEHAAWVARDPIERTRARLIRRFAIPPERLAEIDRQMQTKVEAAVAFALSSPDPQPSDALSHVFAD